MSKNYVQSLVQKYLKWEETSCTQPAMSPPSSTRAVSVPPFTNSMSQLTAKTEVFLLRIWHKKNLQKSISKDTKTTQNSPQNSSTQHQQNHQNSRAHTTPTIVPKQPLPFTKPSQKPALFFYSKGSILFFRSRDLWCLFGAFE